jgi:hypothetical protein
MRTILYGKKAANLYTQAFVQNTQARALYQESEDTYYQPPLSGCWGDGTACPGLGGSPAVLNLLGFCDRVS